MVEERTKKMVEERAEKMVEERAEKMAEERAEKMAEERAEKMAEERAEKMVEEREKLAIKRMILILKRMNLPKEEVIKQISQEFAMGEESVETLYQETLAEEE